MGRVEEKASKYLSEEKADLSDSERDILKAMLIRWRKFDDGFKHWRKWFKNKKALKELEQAEKEFTNAVNRIDKLLR